MGFNPRALSDAVREDLKSILLRDPYHGDPDSAVVFAAHHLCGELFRKFQDNLPTDGVNDVALRKFMSVNDRMATSRYDGSLAFEHHAEIFGMMRDEIRSFYESLPMLDSSLIAHHGSLGPGVNLGSRATDFYSKLFGSKLTATTPTLYDMYRSYLNHFPVWREAEAARSGLGIEYVTANKMSFVPKNDKTARVICVEPSLNMFFQLGLGRIVENGLLRRYGLRISGSSSTEQDHNRELARIGSLDGSFATIDLSSASDSLGIQLLEQLFPRQFLAWFKLFRSPNVKLPSGEVVRLNMISTMGNGSTFPLMTLVFTSLVVSVLKHRGIFSHKERNWGVFGDDLVVPTSVFHTVVDMLGRLGFQPNADKTFGSGPFRESCGSDFFLGQSVRPVYLKTLATQQSRYIALNRLVDWCAMTGLSLPGACEFLLASVRHIPVPSYAPIDSGIRLPASLTKLRRNRNGSYLYKRYEPRPMRYKVNESGLEKCPDKIPRVFNPEGLFLCFLRGDVTNGYVSVRGNGAGAYRSKVLVSHNWDTEKYTLPGGNPGWPRWEAAAHRCYSGVMSP
jgi:hypothetical protein